MSAAATQNPVLENTGYCPTCASQVTFRANSPSLRGSYLCCNCGSVPRERALMHVIETWFPDWRSMTLHESSPAGRAASMRLQRECKGYIASQFFSNVTRGLSINGVRSEDLEQLTFEDESIDLHITQDVMEHVLRPERAFRELARTLKPGGAHVFTVPLVNIHKPSQVRACAQPDGQAKHLQPPVFHGNPLNPDGSLVTVDWGYDICRHIFEACGLFTQLIYIDDLSRGIRAEYIEVLITLKPPTTPTAQISSSATGNHQSKTHNIMELVPAPELIKESGIGEGDFCAIGEGMVQGLIDRGLLQPGSRVLDVGCGLGRLARPLVRFLKGGDYHGLDVSQSSITWCIEHYRPYPCFHFEWLDAYSKFYNPSGRLQAEEYRFPFEAASFDFVMLTSLFTHMLPKDAGHYLAEVGRVLKPGGQCYASYFLLSEELNRAFSKQSQYSLVEGGYVSDPMVPEKAVFVREVGIKPFYAKNGLIIKSISYGSWSGDKSAGGYEDEIIAVKRKS